MIIEYIKEYQNNPVGGRSKVSKALGGKLIALGVAKQITLTAPAKQVAKQQVINKAVKPANNKRTTTTRKRKTTTKRK